MSWSYWLCDSQSGQKMAEIELTSNKWSRRLAGGQDGTAIAPVTSDEKQLVLHDPSTYVPWSTTLVTCWDSQPQFSGLVKRSRRKGNSLTLEMVDLETFLKDRYPHGVTSYWADEENHIPGELVITGKSYEAAVGKVVEQSLLGPSSAYPMPVALPSLSTAGPFTKTFYNYHWESLPDVLSFFRALGVEVDFRPRWSEGDTHEWELRVGAPTVGLSGPSIDFVMNASELQLEDVEFMVDGENQITGHFGVGEGSERLMRVGGDGLFEAATIPARDAVENYPNERDESVLASLGTAAVAAQSAPARFWNDIVLQLDTFDISLLQLGSQFRFHYGLDKPGFPPGWHSTRVIGLSGTDARSVSVDVLET